MNRVKIGGYVRITKKEARRRFNAGENVYLVPCKVSPVNHWGIMFEAHPDNISSDPDFDKTVMYFEWYNCQYNELGRYPAFYRKEA